MAIIKDDYKDDYSKSKCLKKERDRRMLLISFELASNHDENLSHFFLAHFYKVPRFWTTQMNTCGEGKVTKVIKLS